METLKKKKLPFIDPLGILIVKISSVNHLSLSSIDWPRPPSPPPPSPGLVQIPVSMYQTVVTSLAQGNRPVQVAMAPVATRIENTVTLDGHAVEVVTLEQWRAVTPEAAEGHWSARLGGFARLAAKRDKDAL